ncbi:MAG: hypothetical protein LBH63_05245 [Clostridiales Family XIII bacterium]|jgi:hypothetical protein|nr:hypothetical protein [Clostridiales Family XIII bacterium]
MTYEDLSENNYVYVVLSRSSGLLSRLVRAVKGDEYTHAALSLDLRLEYMFSFGRRRTRNPFIGCFKRERICDAPRRPGGGLPGVVIEIPVSRMQYKNVIALIETFLLNSHLYGYNYLGLARNLWGRSRPIPARFFCSEFVYHVLHKNKVCDLGKPRNLVRPQDLMSIKGRVVFEGDLNEYRCSPGRETVAPRIFKKMAVRTYLATER